MATVTLAESAKLTQNMFIAGVIETVVTVDRFFEMLPFQGIDGNALQYTREDALGDVQMLGVGEKITARNAATFTTVNVGLTRIIGDAEVDNLIQKTRSGEGNDQTAVQIASKAKASARKFQAQLINGTGVGNEFTGIDALCAASQEVDTGANGSALTFELLDELHDQIIDKDGQVDYFALNRRTIRSFKALLRGLGGAAIDEVIELPSGKTIPSYSGVPMFANDFIETDQTKGTATNTTTVYAGTFDEGAMETGIAGLTTQEDMGINYKNIGDAHDADEMIHRIVWYCSLALFSELGLAKMPGITN